MPWQILAGITEGMAPTFRGVPLTSLFWRARFTSVGTFSYTAPEISVPTIVADALREHVADMPVSGRDVLILPGRDGSPLAPSALYGREARTERREGRAYTKTAYGFYAAREAIGKPDLHWHAFGAPQPPSARKVGRRSARCSTGSATRPQRWRCATRPRPLSATAQSPHDCSLTLMPSPALK